MDNKIGKFIQSLRKEAGLTQEELANKLIMVRENVSKMERGVNKPTIETLLKLSNIFDISINELLAGKRKNITNEKEINNKYINLNLKKIKTYKKLIFMLIYCFSLIIIIIINLFKINETKIYSFLELDIEGIVIFKNNYGYLNIISDSYKDSNFEIIFYYIEQYNILNNYSFISFDLKNRDTIKTKEVMLLKTKSTLSKFKYNKYKKDTIINNSYLKIIKDNQEFIIKLKYMDL